MDARNRLSSAADVTSAAIPMHSPPSELIDEATRLRACSSRPFTMTLAPERANWHAVSAPSAFDAPVTRTTFPFRSGYVIAFMRRFLLPRSHSITLVEVIQLLN